MKANAVTGSVDGAIQVPTDRHQGSLRFGQLSEMAGKTNRGAL